MTAMDLKLIKMVSDHYWEKKDTVVDKLTFKGRTFYNKFEKINASLNQSIINKHIKGEITIAHSIVNKHNKVENIVIDYNGRDEGYINFTAYKTKTDGHLHVYIHKGHTTLQEAIQLGKMISMKLAAKQPKQWRMFPNADMPDEYNILTLPYEVYSKERGASWSKHM